MSLLWVLRTEQVSVRMDRTNKTFHFATKFLVCPNMKVNNLKKILRCMQTMQPQIHVPIYIAEQARISLERMLQVK
jgi:quinolinate synthase